MTARATKRRANRAPMWQVTPAAVYLLLLFAVPGAVLLLYSFWQKDGFEIARTFTVENYRQVLTKSLYFDVALNSLVIGLVTALLTVLISYPLAYGLTFRFKRFQGPLLLLVFVSVVGSYLARIYAWKSILGERGLINEILLVSGMIREPLSFLVYNRGAVIITLTNIFVPFAFLPIFSAMQNIDPDLIGAARDLGAGPGQVFYRVTLPLSLSGVYAGYVYTFVFASSDFVVTSLVGGKTGLMLSKIIADQFGVAFNWPLGSALAFYFIAMVVLSFLAVRAVLIVLKVRGGET